MRFRTAIILLFTLLLTITLSVVTLNGYFQARHGILDLSGRVINGALDMIVLHTLKVMGSATCDLESMALALQDRDFLAERERLLPLLWNLNHRSQFHSSTYLADTKGNFLQARKHPNLATRVNFFGDPKGAEEWVYRDEMYKPTAKIENPRGYNPLECPWYKAAQASRKASWSDVSVWASTGTLGVTASYPVVGSNGNLQGVLGIDIGLGDLNQFVASEKLGDDSVLLIINGSEQIIAHSFSKTNAVAPRENESLPRLADLPPERYQYIQQAWNEAKAREGAADDPGQGVHNLQLQGESYFVKRKIIPSVFGNDWHLLMVVPDYEVMDTVNRALYTSMMLSVILLIVAIYAIYLIANRLTIPLRQIVANSDLLSRCRFDDLKPVNSVFSELKMVDASMQRMKRSLIAFSRYAPTNLVLQLLSGNKREVELGGETRRLVLFSCEIGDFSQITQSLSANEMILYLSRYQTEMLHALESSEATLNSINADRVVGFWGAPVASPNDDYRGCAGALRCLEIIEMLNEDLRPKNLPMIDARIALHADGCIVGNFGSEQQMFYSALGDGVQVVLWLRGLNSRYGARIIVSRAVYDSERQDFCFRWLDRVTPPFDNAEPMDIFELMPAQQAAQHLEYIKGYESALKLRLVERNAAAATARFRQLQALYPDDPAIAWQVRELS
ncbi:MULTISPECIES: cache domain-containing protein [unclassified Thiocapsa]|uniref:cache domain-containing protein n=1 Tax=unclassified Thiocapsa TaxID=2641286 RepID=UPI0035B35078